MKKNILHRLRLYYLKNAPLFENLIVSPKKEDFEDSQEFIAWFTDPDTSNIVACISLPITDDDELEAIYNEFYKCNVEVQSPKNYYIPSIAFDVFDLDDINCIVEHIEDLSLKERKELAQYAQQKNLDIWETYTTLHAI